MACRFTVNSRTPVSLIALERYFPPIRKHSSLNVRQVKVSLLPAHNHELAQIQLGLFQIFML